MSDIFTLLAAPFNPSDLEWRPGATNADKTKALALTYLTSRAVMDRLDDVVGPPNWRDDFKPGPDGGLICGLSLRLDGEWITKWDGAENTDIEAIKGGLSDAFKRAAVKWGIGRYLYKLPSAWVACEQHGKNIILKSTPVLPEWALPSSNVRTPPHSQPGGNEPPAKPRDQQILEELGFPPASPSNPEKVPAGGNGNMRPRSWNGNIVEAVLKDKLAASPVEAVRLLNASNLDLNASAEQVISCLRATCKV
jgi:hypothetical protein